MQRFSDLPAARLVMLILMLTLFTTPLAIVISQVALRQLGTVLYVGGAYGTITSSQLESSYTTEKPTPGLRVHYTYTVGGREYEGDRISYSIYYEGAPELASRFAQGARVPVYYRSQHPQEAVLLRGPQGETLLILLFTFSLLVVPAMGWTTVARAFQRRQAHLGMYQVEGRLHIPLSLDDLDVWLWVAFGAAGVGGLIWWGIERPSMGLMIGVWAGLLVLCRWARLQQRRRQESGRYDLVLDERRERLLVPPMYGRTEQLELPLSRLQALCIEQDFMQTRDGPVPFWRSVLKFSAYPGPDEQVTLSQWFEEDRAISLATWLHQRAKVRTELNGLVINR